MCECVGTFQGRIQRGGPGGPDPPPPLRTHDEYNYYLIPQSQGASCLGVLFLDDASLCILRISYRRRRRKVTKFSLGGGGGGGRRLI